MIIALDDTSDVRVGMYMEITVDDFSMDPSIMDDPSTQKKTFTLMSPFIMKENGNSYVMKEVDGRLQKINSFHSYALNAPMSLKKHKSCSAKASTIYRVSSS